MSQQGVLHSEVVELEPEWQSEPKHQATRSCPRASDMANLEVLQAIHLGELLGDRRWKDTAVKWCPKPYKSSCPLKCPGWHRVWSWCGVTSKRVHLLQHMKRTSHKNDLQDLLDMHTFLLTSNSRSDRSEKHSFPRKTVWGAARG